MYVFFMNTTCYPGDQTGISMSFFLYTVSRPKRDRHREPGNLMLRHSILTKALRFLNFRCILEALRVMRWNSTSRFLEWESNSQPIGLTIARLTPCTLTGSFNIGHFHSVIYESLLKNCYSHLNT